MKNKKVYVSPDVQGIYIMKSITYKGCSSLNDYELKQESDKREREKESEEKKNKRVSICKG